MQTGSLKGLWNSSTVTSYYFFCHGLLANVLPGFHKSPTAQPAASAIFLCPCLLRAFLQPPTLCFSPFHFHLVESRSLKLYVSFEAQIETENLSLFRRPVLLWFKISTSSAIYSNWKCLAQMFITYLPSLPLIFSRVNLFHIAASICQRWTFRKRSMTSLSHHNQAIHDPGHISLNIIFLVLCFNSKDPPFRILNHDLHSSAARPSVPVIPPKMSSISSLIVCPNVAVE